MTKKSSGNEVLLGEVAWEVCNQVGGIYTVIRSKLPATIEKWGDNYFNIGPYVHPQVDSEFEPASDYSDSIGKVVLKLREQGLDVHYGRWLVSGRPKVVLLNPHSIFDRLGDIKYALWDEHKIPTHNHDPLIDQVISFGEMVKIFFAELENELGKAKLIAHFHEWMAATSIPGIRKLNSKIKMVFTTHATILGRYLAMNDSNFYDHLESYNWEVEAKKFNIEAQVFIERAAAHGSHVFSTVSEVTGRECEFLLGRKPDVYLPNGLNIERFVAMHESQNLHQTYKEKIHRFVMGHFFPSYSFDLDKTLYFFTSGRFEYRNKGYDLTLESLARLNWRLQQEGSDATVVMFFITKKPCYSINPKVMQQRASLENLRETCDEIKNSVGDQLFYQATLSAEQKVPPLNDFVPEHLRLNYRRTVQSWKSDDLPLVITHTLRDKENDEILNFIRGANLINNSFDRVKIVYHPDFISSINPLFHMDYDNFVRGCHLGVFPSYYEPWGYTPLECIARGIPTITSNLSGFGDYVINNMEKPQEKGVYIVDRVHKNFDQSADEMADQMFKFIHHDRKFRIQERTKAELSSFDLDWEQLRKFYDKAYDHALKS